MCCRLFVFLAVDTLLCVLIVSCSPYGWRIYISSIGPYHLQGAYAGLVWKLGRCIPLVQVHNASYQTISFLRQPCQTIYKQGVGIPIDAVLQTATSQNRSTVNLKYFPQSTVKPLYLFDVINYMVKQFVSDNIANAIIKILSVKILTTVAAWSTVLINTSVTLCKTLAHMLSLQQSNVENTRK